MKKDSLYVKDSLSSQFDNEDKIRKQKKMDFIEQQKRDYLEYLQMKDNKRVGTPFKITEDANYHPPIKNLESQEANLCTNIAKDNQYSRAGYQVNQWKIPDRYEKNFDEKYIRGKNRNGYNIINHQIYNMEDQNNRKMDPSLREELTQYEKNLQDKLRNQFPPINTNMYRPQSEQLSLTKENPNKPNYGYDQKFPPINDRTNNKLYEKQSEYNRNPINNNYNQSSMNKNKMYDENNYIPKESNYNNNNIIINQRNESSPKLDDEKYKNYLEYMKQKELYEKEKEKEKEREYEEYIKQKELYEKEKEYEEYLKQKELMESEELQKQNINNNLNDMNKINYQNLPSFRTFINTAEDYNNKQKSYIDAYAENMEKQRRDLEYKREQEQKVLTKENMELYAQQQQNNKFKSNLAQLPFDRFQEEREEYFSNKKKNISTYSNLTSMTTTNPALKNNPNVMPYVDPEKALEMKLKEEKMKKYRRELDEQIRTRPQEAYGRINNDRRIEVPPDPCKFKYIY